MPSSESKSLCHVHGNDNLTSRALSIADPPLPSQGYYCPYGATTYYACPGGYYCPSGTSTYASCPAGRYSPSCEHL